MAFTLDKIFLPDVLSSIQTITTLGTFSVPFIFRPLGSLVFGALGDKIGRQRVLVMTIVVMLFSISGVGLIPLHNSAGTWSSIILLLLRIVQGFSTDEEYAGVPIFVAKYSPDYRRGFMTSWLDFGSILGFLLGAGVVSTLHLLSGDNKFTGWGWRIPLFLALLLGIIGLCLRYALGEAPAFQEHTVNMSHEKKDKTGLHDLFRKYKRSFLTCSGIIPITNVTYYMLLTYLPSYFSCNPGYPENHGALIIIVVTIGMLFVQPLIGQLGDKYDRHPFILTGSSSLLLFSWPPFHLLTTGKPVLIFFGLLVLALLLNTLIGAMTAILSALFPAPIRYSGLVVMFNISVILAGLTPTITSLLVETTRNLHIPAFYPMIFGLFGLMATKLMHGSANESFTGGKPLTSGKAEARELLAKHRDRVEKSIEIIGKRVKELQRKCGILAVQHLHIDQYLHFEVRPEAI